jgi:hypothetical protein
MTQLPFSLTQKMLLQTTHRVTKRSGAAHMKSTLSVTAMQAMRLMIGLGQNANSKRSLFSPETGIVFTTRLLRFQMLKLPYRTRKRERDQVNDDTRDFYFAMGKGEVRSKRCLTLPTLLEMYGKRVYQDISRISAAI